jgi:RNA polymerase sigma-70 factor (ECF subfamily)
MNICELCGGEFERPRKSKRRTCSQKCWAALSWRNPETRAKRCASIRATKLLPKYRKIAIEANHRRWARPGEREKLAERNRNLTPQQLADRGRRIAARWANDPELTKRASDFRRAWWQVPENRQKAVDIMRTVHQSDDAKAGFSARLRARWQNPRMRTRLLAHLRDMVCAPEFREAMRQRMLVQWQDEGFRQRLTAWMREPGARSAASIKAWETRRGRGKEFAVFANLVEAQRPNLQRHALKFTSYDAARADDLVQSAILKALQAREQFTPGTNLGGWVYTILRRLFLDLKRRDWRQESYDGYDEDSGFQIVDEAGPNAEAASELADVLSLIRGLNEEARTTLMLIAGGMSYEEVAAQTGVALGTVKSRVARARAALLDGTGPRGMRPASGGAHDEMLAEFERAGLNHRNAA